MPLPKGFCIQEVIDSDRADVLEVLDQVFSIAQRTKEILRGPELWDWKYRKSIFGHAVVHAIRSDQQVAAVGCLWPLTLRWKGELLTALQPCDTAVHPDFRGQGLFRYLNEERKLTAERLGADLLFNFPNANSLRGYVRSGWSFVGKVPWMVRILKPFLVLKARFHSEKSMPLNVPSDVRLYVGDFSRFESNSDEVFGSVSVARLPGYFNWRFCDHPNRQYGVVESSGGGFAVFTLAKTPSGLVEFVVTDMSAQSSDFNSLLKELVKYAKAMDASFIAMMKPRGCDLKTLFRNGFFQKFEKNLTVLTRTDALKGQLEALDRWDLRASMHDSI